MTEGASMRPKEVPADAALPEPGTTEAIEQGRTCAAITHDSATDEREPAGMVIVTDANCPLHGAAVQQPHKAD
jgi:hypothetical protein